VLAMRMAILVVCVCTVTNNIIIKRESSALLAYRQGDFIQEVSIHPSFVDRRATDRVEQEAEVIRCCLLIRGFLLPVTST